MPFFSELSKFHSALNLFQINSVFTALFLFCVNALTCYNDPVSEWLTLEKILCVPIRDLIVVFRCAFLYVLKLTGTFTFTIPSCVS